MFRPHGPTTRLAKLCHTERARVLGFELKVKEVAMDQRITPCDI